MVSLPELDFIVLGQQKAGTTALFHLLKQHPMLCLPRDKEFPVFHEVEGEDARLRLSGAFRGCRPGALRGKITPQYFGPEGVPGRLASTFPRTTLFAVIRDPLDRAASQYRMNVVRGIEGRTFDMALSDQLTPSGLVEGRRSLDESSTYVAWSEAGRVVSGFEEALHQSVHLIRYQTLRERPEAVVDAICAELGLDPIPALAGVGEVHNEAGSFKRFERLERGVRRVAVLRRAWRLIPEAQRREVAFRADMWRRRGPSVSIATDLSPDVATLAKQHFLSDRERLTGGSWLI